MKPNRKELVRLQRVLDDNEHDLALVAEHLSRVHERLTIASTTLSLMQLHADTTIEPPPESIGPVERFHMRQEQICGDNLCSPVLRVDEDHLNEIEPEDAALIAAAPDLLAALETCAHELSFQCSGSSGHDAFLAARAAIAKAKGT